MTFCLKEDYQELNMAKSLAINFKIAGNWACFTIQSRCVVTKRFYYYIVSCFSKNEIVFWTYDMISCFD